MDALNMLWIKAPNGWQMWHEVIEYGYSLPTFIISSHLYIFGSENIWTIWTLCVFVLFSYEVKSPMLLLCFLNFLLHSVSKEVNQKPWKKTRSRLPWRSLGRLTPTIRYSPHKINTYTVYKRRGNQLMEHGEGIN